MVIGTTLKVSGVEGDATPTYQWYHDSVADGNEIQDATGAEYTLVASDYDKVICVKVTAGTSDSGDPLTADTGSYTVVKKTTATPNGQVSFVLTPNEAGNKYKLAITYEAGNDGITADQLEFSTSADSGYDTETNIEETEINPGTEVTVYARVKETDEAKASDAIDSGATTATAAPDAPTISKVDSTNRKIEVGVDSGALPSAYEISLDSGVTWTDAGTAGGSVSDTTLTIPVDGNTAYAAGTIKVRVAKTATTVAGTPAATSAALTAALAGTVTLKVERDDEEVKDSSVKVGDKITAIVTTDQSDATLQYAFTGNTTGAASSTNTYTVGKDDIGKTITVTVTASDSTLYTGSIAPAAATAEVTAKDAAALYVADVQEAAPTAEVTNDASYKYTYAPKITEGLEFQYVEGTTNVSVGESWTAGSSISSEWANKFDPGKTYTFYARRAEDTTNGVAAGTEVVSWTVDFPKLQHKNLVLNYAITTEDTNNRKVAIDQPSDHETVSYLYTFDESDWASTYEKTFEGAVNSTTSATIGIKNDDSNAEGVFEDSDPVTEYVADVSADKATAPAETPSFVFKVNEDKTAYNLTITYSGTEQSLEYSTDGKTFDTKENIENAEYAPGESVTVYVRVPAGEGKLASNSKASSESTANAAPAAPTVPTLTFTLGDDNKYTLAITRASADSDKTLEYSTDGTNFSTDTKSTIEGKTYAPGEAVTVYVRVAGTESTLVSAAAWISETAPAKATAPTITITSGSVTITAAAGYTIYYTTDGSDPTSTTGTQYSTAFTVTSGTTVKAIACADNIVTSDVASKTYTVSTGTITPSTDKDKTDTDKTTTEPTITTDEDGTKTIVDADGKVIANEKVTIDGKSYITDENGEVLTSQIAETPSGNKVYVGKDGAIVKNKTVTTGDGKKYYATGSGKIATGKFVTTAKGNLVYASKTGALKVNQSFTVNGKKYYAKASGVVATASFVKTASGNTVYATKSGALKVNKAFTVDGKKYVATKSGKIVKGGKYTIGNKTYTTNKKGVVIKVTTKKTTTSK
jgi:hypothetical protein